MTKVTRLTALDGLRGFAILLVFLNHIPTSYIQNVLPSWLFGWIYSNGVTGVTFLFILSGFLMSTIYSSPKSAQAFLQKRYTRIFPLFLTMCAVMFTGGLWSHATPITFAEILFGYAIFTYLVWTQVVKKLPKLFGTWLFYGFLLLQTTSAFLYLFWINKLSFTEFVSLPTVIHNGLIFLTNATLTLPLGQYVPMLDGVYWTLVAEVLFYMLYPTVVVPLSRILSGKPLKIKMLFLLSLLPLFGGIHILSYKIFVLSLIQPALFFYFATGIFLGFLYRNYFSHFSVFSERIFKGLLGIIPFILFFGALALVNDLSFLGQTISPWIRMLFAPAFTFFVAILLDNKTAFSKFFSNKLLAYIGTVSYSIYLSHSLVIHVATLLGYPASLVSNLAFTLVVFLVNIGVASLLFFLLERPYFAKDLSIKQNQIPRRILLKPIYLVIGICLIYVIGIIAAYQSKNSYNFFSLVVPISQHGSSKVTITAKTPFSITLSGLYNNLGLVSFVVHHDVKKNNTAPQALQFALVEQGSKRQIAIATYSLNQFDKGLDFPFGFPAVANSKGKVYTASFTMTNPDSSDFVIVDATSLKEVYAADKKELLGRPGELFVFIWSKIQTVTGNPQAQFALVLLVPFAVLTFVLPTL